LRHRFRHGVVIGHRLDVAANIRQKTERQIDRVDGSRTHLRRAGFAENAGRNFRGDIAIDCKLTHAVEHPGAPFGGGRRELRRLEGKSRTLDRL
jgi:hypothetical protein